jgi:hypothetical protein
MSEQKAYKKDPEDQLPSTNVTLLNGLIPTSKESPVKDTGLKQVA